jgi:ankyrin repeat protein
MKAYSLIIVATILSLAVPANGQIKKTQSSFDALRQGDVAKVKAAINNGDDVNSRDMDGNTLLMQAAVYAATADLDFLLAHGADVNAANKAGHTALMRAMPDLAKVKLLVEHGANVNAVASGGNTPLLIAAHIRSADEVVRYLIQNGADPKAVAGTGANAVMLAAAQGASANLKVLLDAGASGASSSGSVMRLTVRPGTVFDQATVDRLKKRLEGATALMSAARDGCETCVSLLLEHGADVKARPEEGVSALHYAAYTGSVSMVKRLLKAGAVVNTADDRGLTPLMMASNSRNKNPEVVRLLLDKGADVEAKDEFGRTAAAWARIGASPEIMKMLPGPISAEAVKTSAAQPAFKDIHSAVAKSIALLEEASPKFFPKSGCISCHNVSIPLMAISEARHRGYPVKDTSTQQLVKQTVASPALGPQRDSLLSGYCPILTSVGTYAAISLHGEGYTPDSLTDGIARCLAVEQFPDGHWSHGGERPPLSAESDIPSTALSAKAVKLYAPPALARDLDARVARASEFLISTKPWYGDDYAYRLLGLVWTEAKDDHIKAAVRDLLAQQHSDGGWAQSPDMSSDAYETGLSLSALAAASSSSVNSAAYRRGVDYLMRNQETDGSWHVRTRAFGFQPYFESGFPHGRDQWISMAATAWSAMALMPAAEPSEVRATR